MYFCVFMYLLLIGNVDDYGIAPKLARRGSQSLVEPRRDSLT